MYELLTYKNNKKGSDYVRDAFLGALLRNYIIKVIINKNTL